MFESTRAVVVSFWSKLSMGLRILSSLLGLAAIASLLLKFRKARSTSIQSEVEEVQKQREIAVAVVESRAEEAGEVAETHEAAADGLETRILLAQERARKIREELGK